MKQQQVCREWRKGTVDLTNKIKEWNFEKVGPSILVLQRGLKQEWEILAYPSELRTQKQITFVVFLFLHWEYINSNFNEKYCKSGLVY